MKKQRIAALISFILALTLEIIIGAYIKDDFVRPYLGDIVIVFVVFYFLKIIIPNNKYLPFYSFAIACVVEVTQLFHLTTLLNVTNPVLKTIMGGTFDFIDILCYGIGTLIIVLLNAASDKRHDV